MTTFHIEVKFRRWGTPTNTGYDFDSESLVAYSDPSADIRLGGIDLSIIERYTGYKRIIALNGGGVANLGLVDFDSIDLDDAQSATYSSEVSTLISGRLYRGTVFLVMTGEGTYAKMRLDGIDFTNPNGLIFYYEFPLGPPIPDISGAVEDINSNIDNKGIANSLISKLNNALDALERGNINTYTNILNAFINQVEAQSGKKIDLEYAATLIEWANYWLENP